MNTRITFVLRRVRFVSSFKSRAFSSVAFENIELLQQDENTTGWINKIISREKEKNPHFEDAFTVTDLGDVCRKMKAWRHHLPRVEPFYAVKCNDDMNILSTLTKLGASFDCASRDEIAKVLQLGVSSSRIVYAHPIKQSGYLRFAADRGVDTLTFDCQEELEKINSIFPKSSLVVRIRTPPSYSVDLKFPSQFGCHAWEVPPLLSAAKKLGLNIIGVRQFLSWDDDVCLPCVFLVEPVSNVIIALQPSFHVGSGFLDGQVYRDTLQVAEQVFDMATSAGFSMSLLDIGGGFWGNNKPPVTFSQVAKEVNQALDQYFPEERGVKIISEPGRYFVSSAVTLALSVIGKKTIPQYDESDYPSRDCTRMYFVNDGRYGNFSDVFYTTTNVCKPEVLKTPDSKSVVHRSSVWGQSLSTEDCIFENCELPDLDLGDWLYVENVGAYTSTLHRGDIKFNGMQGPRRYYVCSKELWDELNCL